MLQVKLYTLNRLFENLNYADFRIFNIFDFAYFKGILFRIIAYFPAVYSFLFSSNLLIFSYAGEMCSTVK